MNFLENLFLSKTFLFLLVFARIEGFVLLLPVVGGRNVPRQIRFWGAVAVSLAITPLFWATSISLPNGCLTAGIALLSEFLTGLFISTGVLIFFNCLTVAGETIGRLGGVSISSMFDSASGDETTPTALFLTWAGIAVFILAGGLGVLITGLIDSFFEIPPGSIGFRSAWATSLIPLLQSSVDLAFRIAAPVIVATLVVFFVVGILGRTFPQLNVFSISFSCASLLTFAILHLGIGISLLCFQSEISGFLQTIFESISVPLRLV